MSLKFYAVELILKFCSYEKMIRNLKNLIDCMKFYDQINFFFTYIQMSPAIGEIAEIHI